MKLSEYALLALAALSAQTLFGVGLSSLSGSSAGSASFEETPMLTPVSTPVFHPAAGTYLKAQSVTFSDSTPGAAIYYTTNGKMPTKASAKYTGAITVSGTETINAIAVKTGHTESAVATATYIIERPAATPVFTPKTGTYTRAQSVTITDSTPGAAIHYTTDGATPSASSTKYTGAITVSSSETLEAIAIAKGFDPSAVEKMTYTIKGGGAGSFWIPFSAEPVSGAKDGTSGLFVIASNAIARKTPPEPRFVSNSVPTFLGLAFQGFVSGGGTTSQTPAVFIYAATDGAGKGHVYGLDLTDTSKVPAPAQLTDLSVPSTEHICGIGQVETDLTMPDSLAVVIYVTPGISGAMPGTVGYCGSTPGTNYLIPYTAPDSTPPTMLSVPGASKTLSAFENDGIPDAHYLESGKLGGLELWDASTKDLNFYTDDTFTTSSTLLRDVSSPVACVNINAVLNGVKDSVSGRSLVTVNHSKNPVAYQITASGEAAQFFNGDATQCVTDADHLFFLGTPPGSNSVSIYEEPAAATPPAQMLITVDHLGLPPGLSSPTTLIGSTGSKLVFQMETICECGAIDSEILALPEGETSMPASLIAGPYPGMNVFLSAFLAQPSGGAADDIVFVTATEQTGDSTIYEGQAVTPSGAVKLTESNAVWLSFGVNTTELAGNVLEISGITDTNGAYGGGTLNQVDVNTLTATPLTADGSAYLVPSGYRVNLGGVYGTHIAAGTLVSIEQPQPASIGAAINVSQHVIVPISIKDTNVTTWF